MVNKPVNLKLYEKIKKEAKRKFKVWPSAYASGWLVREYKRRGGIYKSKSPRKSPRRKSLRKSPRKSGLSRWFREEWIDVCKLPKIVQCGRKSARHSKRTYPYCRPRYKISSESPRTAGSLTMSEIRKRCRKKKKNPSKRIIPRYRS